MPKKKPRFKAVKATEPVQEEPMGEFIWSDDACLYYNFTHHSGSVFSAAKDALELRRALIKREEFLVKFYFWFCGTPTPIKKGDSVNRLIKRWRRWCVAYQLLLIKAPTGENKD